MFGGKEFNDELGLDWMDFGARNYDASLGRWMNLDPLAERVYEFSPYNYAINNPIVFTDPTGQLFIFFFEGENSQENKEYLTRILNNLLGGEFEVDFETFENGSNLLSIKGDGSRDKLSDAGKAFYDAAKDEENVSVLDVVENDENTDVGSFANQIIDVGDIREFARKDGDTSGDSEEGLTVHELVEQNGKAKQGIPKGEAFKNGSLATFYTLHDTAISAENSANGNTRLSDAEIAGNGYYVKYFKEKDGTITEVRFTTGDRAMQVTKKTVSSVPKE